MGKRLVIAEKPSVARDIAAALGGFREAEDYLEADGYIVTWAVGHLLELAEPKAYDKAFGSWSLKNLPIIPEAFQFVPKDGQKQRLALIKRLGARADVDGVVNACDAGREGEMIYRRIAEYAGLERLPQQRLWLQSMTKEAIRQAFQDLRPGSDLDPLADAAWCRAVGDWLIGMNATRALTQRLKSRGETEAWSAGRVQTPTLEVLVAREREILAHEPRPYWEILGRFEKDGYAWEGRVVGSPGEDDPDQRPTRLFDKARVDALIAGLEAPGEATAEEKRKKSRQRPPLPFDLTTLQRESNRRFSFSAKRTLQAAQRLYERYKLLTYPRTDSRHLPGDYEATLRGVLASLASDPLLEVRALAAEVASAPENLEIVLDGSKVSDHFAIVPTGSATPEGLSPDDKRVYDLVVRQTLAALMGPATWVNVERTVSVPIRGEKVPFRTTARGLEVPGFLRALGREAGEPSLPPLVPGLDDASGVPVQILEVQTEEKATKPPGRYSEAALLRMMETAGQLVDEEELSEAMAGRGLGTPATRADIIEGLVTKGYARRVQGKLAPASKAMRLLEVLERANVPALASPRLTGDWEHQLGQVHRGELRRSVLFERLATFTRDVVAHLKAFEHDSLYLSAGDVGPCPACGEGRVVESAWGYPCSRNTGKDAPCNFMLWKDRMGRYVDRRLATALIRDRRVTGVDGFVDRGGRELSGTATLVKDEATGRWKVELELGVAPGSDAPEVVVGPIFACPHHEGGDVIETTHRYVCREILEGRSRSGPSLPKVVCQRELALEEAEAYFGPEARTPVLEGFVSKRGRPFRGALIRKDSGKHGFEFPPRGGADGGTAEGTEEQTAAAAPTGPALPRAAPTEKPKARVRARAAAPPDAPDAPASTPKAKAPAKPKAARAKKKAAPPAPPPKPVVKSKKKKKGVTAAARRKAVAALET